MRNKHPGITLPEMLVGIAVFSTILACTALCINVSHRTLELSGRELPLEIKLQTAMDEIGRLIRPCEDATGAGSSITLTCGGSAQTISYSNGTVWSGGTEVAGGIDSANFAVSPGEVAKIVSITLAASSDPNAGGKISQTITDSTCLRIIAVGTPAPPPPPRLAAAQPPPPPEEPPRQSPPPPPSRGPSPPPRHFWKLPPCGGRFACP